MAETLFPIAIPPGVVRNGTEYAVGGRWYDANLVRFFGGQARPIGGWTKVTTTALTGKARAMLTWRTNSDSFWAAIGTSSKLYVTKFSGTEYDVTPAGFTAGNDDVVYGVGYGIGPYGQGSYGSPRTTPVTLPLSVWHLDTWGENLVGCMRGDGKIYQWALATGTPAAQVTNSPTGCIGVMVTEQRHMMALGASSNPRLIKWSHKEDNTTWTPSTSNEAGSFELQTVGGIKRGIKVRGQNLILTDCDAHVVSYIGYPFVYARNRIGTDCGVIGPNGVASVESFAVWMGKQGWWIYDGTSVRPLPSDVGDYVFSRLNRASAEKIYAAHNGAFGEVTWFYPADNANEPDSYVTWNYREDHWTIGSMARTAWVDVGAFPYPYAMGTDNHAYRHEDGLLNNGATRVGTIYLRSGANDINDGNEIVHVRKILPDEKTAGSVSVKFYCRYTPLGAETAYGPYTIRGDGYTDCRFSGRQAAIRLDATDDSDWRIGKFRLEGTLGGQR